MIHNYLSKIKTLLLFLFFSIICAAQNNYTVSPIPHQAYSASLPVAFTSDDTYSPVIAIGFPFSFFGVTYDSVIVSTNGNMNFSTASAGMFAPWALNTIIPSTTFEIKNAILGAYEDLENSNGEGTVTYGVTGNAPFRKFVLIYNNNSHFQCTSVKSSTQIIIYETLNIIDSQIVEKGLCSTWNGGNAVIGIINAAGTVGISPPNRNTGVWTAAHEGWRFTPETTGEFEKYNYFVCDANLDGVEIFDLSVAQNDLSATNASAVSFYVSATDAANSNGALALSYTNVSTNIETIYANVNGVVKEVILRTLNCETDYDSDGVATDFEDLNSDGNLANDDTDADGIPNFMDNEDDGDLILTSEEYVFGDRSENAPASILDTDNDGIPNYLDNDDDGDGVLTISEDYDGNNNPMDDDTNNDGTPDYLQTEVALKANSFQAASSKVSIYPNPVADILNIENKSGEEISAITIYSINGAAVKTLTKTMTSVSVSDLQSGIYFVKVELGNQVLNYKFIKK